MSNRTTITTALASALLLAACDQPVDSPDFEADPELNVSTVDRLVSDSEPTHSDTALAIAQHPQFPALSSFAWAGTVAYVGELAPLDHDLLEEEYERMDLCQQQESPLACHEDLSAVPLDPQVPAEVNAAGLAISDEFGLAALSPAARVGVLMEAQAYYVAAGGAGGDPDAIPGTFGDGSACDAACRQQVVDKLVPAQAGMMVLASTENGQQLALDAAKAIAVAWFTCLINPACDGWPFDNPDKECNDDGDCSNNQYCWKGPLGVGKNECRAKKSNGDPCSRGGKCMSGCCKFNLWDLGSTCRPANQCN